MEKRKPPEKRVQGLAPTGVYANNDSILPERILVVKP